MSDINQKIFGDHTSILALLKDMGIDPPLTSDAYRKYILVFPSSQTGSIDYNEMGLFL